MVDTEKQKKHVYDIVGAIYEVHNELGPGLNEYCYQEGLQMQLEEQNIPHVREMSFHPLYHEKPMMAEYRVDFLCKGDVIVECKAISELTPNHRAQLFNYMRLQKAPCGILVNFQPRSVIVERYFYDDETKSIRTVNGTEV